MGLASDLVVLFPDAPHYGCAKRVWKLCDIAVYDEAGTHYLGLTPK